MNSSTNLIKLKIPKILILCGEPSGDNLGFTIMKAITHKCFFYGITGPNMRSLGCETIIPMENIAVMGFWEILPKLFSIWRAFHKVIRHIRNDPPDLIITIDNKGFNFRIIKKIQKIHKIPAIHVVAPSVWAVKTSEKRLQNIGKLFDHLMCLWKFEPPYFEPYLPVSFIGHPVLNLKEEKTDKTLKQIAILPGSRKQEIKKHLSIFLKAAETFDPTYEPVIATPPHLKAYVQKHYPNIRIITSLEGVKKCRLAIAASGSVTLELMAYKIPCVVCYKVSKLTEWIVRRLIKIPYISLINILANREIVPELLQKNVHPEKISYHLHEVLKNKKSIQKAYVDIIAENKNVNCMKKIEEIINSFIL